MTKSLFSIIALFSLQVIAVPYVSAQSASAASASASAHAKSKKHEENTPSPDANHHRSALEKAKRDAKEMQDRLDHEAAEKAAKRNVTRASK